MGWGARKRHASLRGTSAPGTTQNPERAGLDAFAICSGALQPASTPSPALPLTTNVLPTPPSVHFSTRLTTRCGLLQNHTHRAAACCGLLQVWNAVDNQSRKGHTSIIHGKWEHEETIATASFAGE